MGGEKPQKNLSNYQTLWLSNPHALKKKTKMCLVRKGGKRPGHWLTLGVVPHTIVVACQYAVILHRVFCHCRTKTASPLDNKNMSLAGVIYKTSIALLCLTHLLVILTSLLL